MNSFLNALLKKALAPKRLDWWQTSPCVKVLCLHAISYDGKRNTAEGLTLDFGKLKEFIERVSHLQHTFITLPEFQCNSLTKERPSVLVTFDDAYANIGEAVKWLTDRGVPCAIFVCADYCSTSRSFWWDVLRVHRQKQGASDSALTEELKALKKLSPSGIRDTLTQLFGHQAVDEVHQDLRAMTPSEISHWAGHPLVTIGNHTNHHAILTNLDEDAIQAEVSECTQMIEKWTGSRSQTLAYPNGKFDERVKQSVAKAGIEFAFTTKPALLSLNQAERDSLAIGRWLHEPFSNESAKDQYS